MASDLTQGKHCRCQYNPSITSAHRPLMLSQHSWQGSFSGSVSEIRRSLLQEEFPFICIIRVNPCLQVGQTHKRPHLLYIYVVILRSFQMQQQGSFQVIREKRLSTGWHCKHNWLLYETAFANNLLLHMKNLCFCLRSTFTNMHKAPHQQLEWSPSIRIRNQARLFRYLFGGLLRNAW